MSDPILATAQSIRRLKGIPASFRLAALALLRTQRGTLQFTLPDHRKIIYRNAESGPSAEIIIHDYNFVKLALAGGDVGFA